MELFGLPINMRFNRCCEILLSKAIDRIREKAFEEMEIIGLRVDVEIPDPGKRRRG